MKSLGEFYDEVKDSKVVAVSKAIVDSPRLIVKLSSELTLGASFWECRFDDVFYSSRGFGYEITNSDIRVIDSAILLMRKFFVGRPVDEFVFSDEKINFSLLSGDFVWSVYPVPFYDVSDLRHKMIIRRAYTFIKGGERWNGNGLNMVFG